MMLGNPSVAHSLRIFNWMMHLSGGALTLGMILLACWCKHFMDRQSSESARQIQSYEDLQAGRLDLQARASKAQVRLNQAQAECRQVHKRLSTEAAEGEYLRLLTDLSRATNLQIKEFRPGRIIGQAPNQVLELQIRGQGTPNCAFF